MGLFLARDGSSKHKPSWLYGLTTGLLYVIVFTNLSTKLARSLALRLRSQIHFSEPAVFTIEKASWAARIVFSISSSVWAVLRKAASN